MGNTHSGSLAYRGCDFEFADEPARSTQSESHALRRAEAVLERTVNIGDAGPIVLKDQLEAGSSTVVDFRDRQCAALAVDQRIASQFARGSDELGPLKRAERQPGSPILDCLASKIDLVA